MKKVNRSTTAKYYIGLDVHKSTISIAYAAADGSDPVFYGKTAGTNLSVERALAKLRKKLGVEKEDLRICYSRAERDRLPPGSPKGRSGSDAQRGSHGLRPRPAPDTTPLRLHRHRAIQDPAEARRQGQDGQEGRQETRPPSARRRTRADPHPVDR